MRTAVLTAVIASFGYAGAVQAQDTTQPATQGGMSDDSAMAPAAAPASSTPSNHMMKKGGMMDVETRIKTLHDKLMITADQEADWAKVAQTMRDNETEIHQLIQARHQDPDSMTAVDDLQSYAKITQAHADGMQKMVTAFQPLYDEMSDAQKKNADQVFGQFEGHHGTAKPTK